MKEENQDFELAYNIVEHTGSHLFLTGRAGTGKTTFLRTLVQRSCKRIVVAAPTGIAAINAGGVTLHSLFQLDFGPFFPGMKRKPLKFSREKLRLIKCMDLLVIDEVSMVRADLLDAVDDMLRRLRNPHKPFGGVQLLLIGDLQQLPPVVTDDEKKLLGHYYDTPYFFSSKALMSTTYVTVELQRVYRQENKEFIAMLGAVRSGHPSAQVIHDINSRYIPGFVPDDSEHWVRLTSHNSSAANINSERLKGIDKPAYHYEATVSGNFPTGVLPAEQRLILKQGAQVMFIRNDPSPAKKFFNGMLGTVVELDEQQVTVLPDDSGQPISVSALEWESRRLEIDTQSGEVKEKIDGVFRQIPLRAAWAITIHKSQGLTFSRAIVDASACFAHGQTYVALSRLRSLDGLVLSSPIPANAIISDSEVNNFMQQSVGRRPDFDMIKAMERQYSASLLDSVYDFAEDEKSIDNLHRIVADAYHKTYPSVVQEYGCLSESFKNDVAKTSTAFRKQYTQLLYTPDSLPQLTERLAASAGYFPKRIDAFLSFVTKLPADIDNADIKKRLKNKSAELQDSLSMKSHIISAFSTIPFSNKAFLDIKRNYILRQEKANSNTKKGKSTRQGNATAASHISKKGDKLPAEILNPVLFKTLVEWRKEEAARRGIPAFRLFHTSTLIHLSNLRPCTKAEFLKVPGCGPQKAAEYFDAISNIISSYSN